MNQLGPQTGRGLVEVALIVFFVSLAAVTIGLLLAPRFLP